MDIPRDGKDPLQKLKELHLWMQTNTPSSRFPTKVKVETHKAWAVQNEAASAEVEDFQNWIKEINRPNFVW